MDEKAWWQSRTMWSGAVSAVASLTAVTGHNLDMDTQNQIIGAIVNIANGVGVVAGLLAMYYRTKATTVITSTPTPPAG